MDGIASRNQQPAATPLHTASHPPIAYQHLLPRCPFAPPSDSCRQWCFAARQSSYAFFPKAKHTNLHLTPPQHILETDHACLTHRFMTPSQAQPTCHAPSSAICLNLGSTPDTTRLMAKAGPPRTTSSAKISTAQGSHLQALPSAVEKLPMVFTMRSAGVEKTSA